MSKSNKESNKIYLDYASGVMPNSSSIHEAGVQVKKKLEKMRAEVAELLFARPNEIIFTSGGTESNNLAIQGIVFTARNFKQKELPHIVTTNIEHASVFETCQMLKKRGLAEVSFVPVEKDGIVNPKKIIQALKKNTVLVSVMYANNEIGTIQPIREIAKEIRYYKKKQKRNNIFFHTDAVQAVNYLDLNVQKLGVDLLSLSGSKIENSGRVGLLYKRQSVSFENVFGGGDQEWGFRPGTENVLAILQFCRALIFTQKIKEKEKNRLIKLQNYFFKKLKLLNFGDTLVINGSLENRLPNNLNISFSNIPSDLLVLELSAKGIMASAKSACKSGDGKVSHVLKAIHPEMSETNGSLRFSMGRKTTQKEIDYTLKILAQILLKLKKWYT